MRATVKILFIICLLFLAGTVGAADVSVISTSRDWVVANGADQAIITVIVSNTTTGLVEGATVDFSVDPVFGDMSPASPPYTGPDGVATSTFTVNKASGAATITAKISYIDAGTPVIEQPITISQNIIDQRITSATPTPPNGTVGQEILFNIIFKDQSGYPFNNQDGDVSVSLSVSCPMPNDCEFVGSGHLFSGKPDENGNLAAPLKLGNRTGLTTIVMDKVQDLRQQVFTIDTEPGPLTLTVSVDPSTLSVPAGRESFSIYYILKDLFGNGVANEQIYIETSLGENLTAVTDYNGMTSELTYGPKAEISTVTLTAQMVKSPGIMNQTTLSFTAPIAKDMTMIVSPQNMSSLDKDPASHSWATVLVHDEYGEPFSGQTITFSLDYSAADQTNWSSEPYLETESAVTDGYGRAIVKFIPGTFNDNGPFTSSAIVTATWSEHPDITKTGTFYWTNRPFLNIDVNATPRTVTKGEFMDVTINVSVSGNPEYRPVTLLLDQDVSGSMSSVSNKTTRLVKAVNAATTFIQGLVTAGLNINMGQISFGNEKANFPQMPIGSDLDDIIDNLGILYTSAAAGEMGPSLETGLDALIAATGPTTTHADDVKVLILMSGGTSNLQNDEPWFTNQINKAVNNDITVFIISYVNNAGDSPNAAVQFNRLADETGGEVYRVWNEETFALVYADITERIKVLADKDTEMTLNFETVKIEDQVFPGTDVYDYVPVGLPDPTVLPHGQVSVPSTTIDNNLRTSIIWPDGNQSMVNQSQEWLTNTLKFHVGEIPFGTTWSTTFRLKPKIPGCYNIFGEGSGILLNGEETVIPENVICVVEEPKNEPFKSGMLNVTDDDPPNAQYNSTDTDFIPLHWQTYYNSTKPELYSATETVSYRFIDERSPFVVWKEVYSVSVPNDKDSVRTYQTMLDIRQFPLACVIQIRIQATAPDARDEILRTIEIVLPEMEYINLT
jgi:hypothetical protein